MKNRKRQGIERKRSRHDSASRSAQRHPNGKERRQERIRGVVSTTSRGTGFVKTEKFEEDILIEPHNLNHALHGDTVEIILHPPRRGERQSGEVIKIVDRAKTHFVGTLKQSNGTIFLSADDKKMYTQLQIPREKLGGGKLGEKVLAKLTEWKKGEASPYGEVLKVIGEKGKHEVEIQSIILDRGIDTRFPEDVMAEAREIEKREKPLPASEISKRKDFRNTLTFTIDPITAKDFDDAISFKELASGNYEIGVHIADVSYYVQENTRLDKEARKRSFSIYLVDRTIPMLPEVLSNDLCSLNPNEDKFAFSAVFEVTAQGKVVSRWFGKTVINSDKRFSYEEAQEVLDKGSGVYHKELSTLNSIAKIFKRENAHKGAIEFEQEEVRFELDDEGRPVRVYKKQRFDTHKLVEEYMLLANREVAEFIHNKQNKSGGYGVSLYRIHDVPDRDRIVELSLFLKALGYGLGDKNGVVTGPEINALLKHIEGKTEEALIKTAAIRSMTKAIYSTKNIGHFGLAFKFYTHFTSPIRRYPDLIVHRVLHNILSGNIKKAQDEFALFERIATEATEKEIEAAEAERASIKYKQVEYMSSKVGQVFDGVVSGVTEWGIYIEESETKAEGMIRLRNLSDDYYELDPKTYSIKGQKTGRRFRLGDKVKVKLLEADLDSRTLDFALA